jgi:hypothetical protein
VSVVLYESRSSLRRDMLAMLGCWAAHLATYESPRSQVAAGNCTSSNQALPSVCEQHHCALPVWTSGLMNMPLVAARRVMSDQISKRVVCVVQPGLRAMISLVTFVLRGG